MSSWCLDQVTCLQILPQICSLFFKSIRENTTTPSQLWNYNKHPALTRKRSLYVRVFHTSSISPFKKKFLFLNQTHKKLWSPSVLILTYLKIILKLDLHKAILNENTCLSPIRCVIIFFSDQIFKWISVHAK